MKKTKTITGWAYQVEDIEDIFVNIDDHGYRDALFMKQEHSNGVWPLKRMTIRVTVEDYKPKRKKT